MLKCIDYDHEVCLSRCWFSHHSQGPQLWIPGAPPHPHHSPQSPSAFSCHCHGQHRVISDCPCSVSVRHVGLSAGQWWVGPLIPRIQVHPGRGEGWRLLMPQGQPVTSRNGSQQVNATVFHPSGAHPGTHRYTFPMVLIESSRHFP